ncbi:hypothetical protein BOTNAR_0131g00050 [Botryotinia narcissicola]|uniref:Wax synthase domain-containing protein n=1 Tax=Botryotinia narcissicola TaxID=278944 RepID=A0A4Z1IHW6_9HELO|nr:hypothetical protein BOTNAR_0131g00050 [Botryotinia narcissicola]
MASFLQNPKSPLYVNGLQLFITSFVIGFTTAHSRVRLAVLPVLLALVWISIPSSYETVTQKMWKSVLASESVTRVIHYIEVAFVTKWTYEANGPSRPNLNIQYADKIAACDSRPPRNNANISSRLSFGIATSLAHRNSGTRFEVKNVPPFSEHDRSYIPTRKEFLRSTALRAGICYIIMDVLSSSGDPTRNAELYAPNLVPVFAKLHHHTFEQLLMRVATSTLNRQRLSSPAAWIIYDVLGMQKGSLAGRYTAMFIVFLISGIIHAIAELATGLKWKQSGVVRYFLTQYFGIVLEDIVKELSSKFGILRSEKLRNVIGYVWVFLFQVWSVPAWMYPQLVGIKGGPEDEPLPFSVVRLLRNV